MPDASGQREREYLPSDEMEDVVKMMVIPPSTAMK
jgi:hypothetical protein